MLVLLLSRVLDKLKSECSAGDNGLSSELLIAFTVTSCPKRNM